MCQVIDDCTDRDVPYKVMNKKTSSVQISTKTLFESRDDIKHVKSDISHNPEMKRKHFTDEEFVDKTNRGDEHEKHQRDSDCKKKTIGLSKGGMGKIQIKRKKNINDKVISSADDEDENLKKDQSPTSLQKEVDITSCSEVGPMYQYGSNLDVAAVVQLSFKTYEAERLYQFIDNSNTWNVPSKITTKNKTIMQIPSTDRYEKGKEFHITESNMLSNSEHDMNNTDDDEMPRITVPTKGSQKLISENLDG